MKISDIATSTQLTDDEYLPIWTALMETARGRRFLSEFARRTRSSETRTLLDAVQKLESALVGARQEPGQEPEQERWQDRQATPEPQLQQREPASRGARQPAASDAAHDLRAAITQAVPELETSSRITVRAMADLQDAADEIHTAASALRLAAKTMTRRDADAIVRACDAIDVRTIDISEIIVVQQIADDRVTAISAELAELVTASPGADALDESYPEHRAPVEMRAAADAAFAADQPRRGVQADRQQRARSAPADRFPPVADIASARQAAAGPASHSPAVQQLIHEITARLLNGQDNRPAS